MNLLLMCDFITSNLGSLEKYCFIGLCRFSKRLHTSKNTLIIINNLMRKLVNYWSFIKLTVADTVLQNLQESSSFIIGNKY